VPGCAPACLRSPCRADRQLVLRRQIA
jgi:hypothetical protein